VDRPEIFASTRTVSGKKVKALRKAGFLPAHIYGRGLQSQSVQIETSLLRKAMAGVGRNVLLSIHVDNGTPIMALVREVQRDAVTDTLLHADFYAVSLTEKIRTRIPINLVGEAPAAKFLAGIVVQSLESLEVECLPTDLMPEVRVDIATLEKLEQSIFVRDLPIPQGWDVLSDAEQMVVKVASPAAAEEAAAPTAEAPTAEQAAAPSAEET